MYLGVTKCCIILHYGIIQNGTFWLEFKYNQIQFYDIFFHDILLYCCRGGNWPFSGLTVEISSGKRITN